MEIQDEEMTCLIQKKVEFEQGKTRLNIARIYNVHKFVFMIKAFFFQMRSMISFIN